MPLSEGYSKNTEANSSPESKDSVIDSVKNSLHDFSKNFESTDSYKTITPKSLLTEKKLVKAEVNSLKISDENLYNSLLLKQKNIAQKASLLAQKYTLNKPKTPNSSTIQYQISILEEVAKLRSEAPFELDSVANLEPIESTLNIHKKNLIIHLVVDEFRLQNETSNPYFKLILQNIDNFKNGLAEGLISEYQNIDNLIQILKENPKSILSSLKQTFEIIYDYLKKEGVAKVYDSAVDGLSDFMLNTYNQDFQNLPFYSGFIFSKVLASVVVAGGTPAKIQKIGMLSLYSSRASKSALPDLSVYNDIFEKEFALQSLTKVIKDKMPLISYLSIDKFIQNLKRNFLSLNYNDQVKVKGNLISSLTKNEKIDTITTSLVVNSAKVIPKSERLYLANQFGIKYIPKVT